MFFFLINYYMVVVVFLLVLLLFYKITNPLCNLFSLVAVSKGFLCPFKKLTEWDWLRHHLVPDQPIAKFNCSCQVKTCRGQSLCIFITIIFALIYEDLDLNQPTTLPYILAFNWKAVWGFSYSLKQRFPILLMSDYSKQCLLVTLQIYYDFTP